ncbi:MAG TPA: sigma 54-interacting transcriptional regulator, partial [Syntrophales bacterium]|nr:sigma 54-interacting transcriptional regulator [Syntrophales bacterium]
TMSRIIEQGETIPTPVRTSSAFSTDKDKLIKGIHRISAFLTAPSSVEDILGKILDEVVDSMGFDRGIILLLDERRENLCTRVVKNYSEEEARRAFSVHLSLKKHDSFETRVAKTGHYIALEDSETDPRTTEADRKISAFYKRGSTFYAPLKIEDDVIGIIAVWTKEKSRFSSDEIDILLTFANQVSIVIHITRLFEINREKIDQLLSLQEAVSGLNSTYSIERIHEILIRSALRIGKAEKALIYFLDIEKNRVFINDGERGFIDDGNEYGDRIGKTIIRKALDGDAITVRQREDGEGDDTVPLYDGFPSEVAIPLKVKDRFKGVLLLGKKTGVYSRDQINVLDILVNNAATSYDSAIMHSMLSIEAKSLKTEVEKLKEREDFLLGFHNILGKSKKMVGIFHVIEEVAKHDTNILIQGESGTGKELVSRAIHRQSQRHEKRFVDVNCAAIPGTLLESELFGYEAGAFTDARKRKIGLLEYASGGTLFLDEIGDMSLPLQAKFLRMLEDGHIRRLGGNESIPVDVRFIFATNRDLSRMVSEGSFREDLYYRISVVPIILPPLRERGDDLLLLARNYVDEFNRKFNKKVKGFTKEAEEILRRYSWPGNVRELKNIIERVMILRDVGRFITPENIPAEIKASAAQEPVVQVDELLPLTSETDRIDYRLAVEKLTGKIKERILTRALKLSGGNRTKAARLLNISRYALIRELKKVGKSAESGT